MMFDRTASGSRARSGPWARWLWVLFAMAALAGPARAVLPGEQLADPKLEARARAIGAQLRCLVCQNQSIDDSDASLAGDLRVILRERLVAGDTDQQAIQFIVQRYGDFVLLKPPFEAETLFLWLGPALILVGGGIWVARLTVRSSSGSVVATPLTPEEEVRLARRLDAENAS